MPENYGQAFPSKKKSERKAELADRYWFDCNCEVSEESLVNSEDINLLLQNTGRQAYCSLLKEKLY